MHVGGIADSWQSLADSYTRARWRAGFVGRKISSSCHLISLVGRWVSESIIMLRQSMTTLENRVGWKDGSVRRINGSR